MMTSPTTTKPNRLSPHKEQRLSSQIAGSGMDRKIEKPKWPLKRIALYAAGAILLTLVVYSFVFGDKSARLNVQVERLTISTVQRGDFQEFIPVNGVVLPIKTIYLDAVQGGRVEIIYLEAGSMLKEGDKILKLENANLQLNIMMQETSLLEQLTHLRNTRMTMEQNRLNLEGQLVNADYQVQRMSRLYDQKKALYDKQLIAFQEYAEAKDELEFYQQSRQLLLETHRQDSILQEMRINQMENSVSRIQENLDMLQQTLESLVLRAPISGHLTSLDAEIGESKSPGQRLGQIDVLEGFKVRAPIDEHYITRIESGQGGEFDLAGETYRLVITKIYPEVQNGQFEVDLEFSEIVPTNIRRGQTVRMRLELGQLAEATLLARGSFYQQTGGRWVFVVDPSGGFAAKKPIQLGRQNPLHYEVLKGLEPGERVITSSYDNFGESDRLILKN
ncbi:MAG: HlyD family efflux transporter periplasmic adaptor subunit [Fidelibacterota bacterium]|nr:MAG: HlyD family efflux transporter periplasmic adaptor subunit [Candidatus Neomarinimicrobiota bacterium]